MKIKTLILFSCVLLLSSCAAHKNVLYFQDAPDGSVEKVFYNTGRIRLQPDDVISIIVKSRDMNLTNLFNLPYYTQRLGSTTEFTNNYSNGVATYLVNQNGDITFPVIGNIHVAGLTRGELADLIQSRLIINNLVKDPVVSVDFANLYVSVLGDVSKPGRVRIDHDEFTLLDAISAAGDLAITGKRGTVRVVRVEDGQQKTYMVDLRSAEQLANSPVYFLKQNDVIYVEPNKMKARQSTVNGNNVLNASFWVSLSSLAVTVFLAVNQYLLSRR